MEAYERFMTIYFPATSRFAPDLETSSLLINCLCYSKLFKSSGTLLTLPARYLLELPTNSLGLGSCESSWNLQRESWIRTMPPPPDFSRPTPALPGGELGPEEEPPPLVSMYVAALVTSSIERRGVGCCC
jgi:hypothetical protein